MSLKRLADHLGLSAASISRVLNAAPAARSIPKATQDRIFAAADALQYRPNHFARSLKNRRSMTIGVMVPEVSEGYATAVLSGVEQHLLQQGYFYFLVSHHHRTELIERYEHLLLGRGVQGIVAIDTRLPHGFAVPTVTVSGHHEPPGVVNIVLNHRRAAELALGHLSGLGHRQIAFLKGQTFSSDTETRWSAIRQAAAKAGLKIEAALVGRLEGESPTHEPGYVATRKLLATGRSFTALFAFNDISAIGAIRALREVGLRIPQDVSVVGFDDVQSAAFQNPALTTIRQPLHDMGLLAAQSLLKQVEGPEGAGAGRTAQLIIDPALVVRDSTAAVGAGTAAPRPPYNS